MAYLSEAAVEQVVLDYLAGLGYAIATDAEIGPDGKAQNSEGDIRRALIEGVDGKAGVVDCMVALPGQLFYSTQIPVCLWFLARDRSNGFVRSDKLRDRRAEILFIDARKLGHMVDRTRKEFSEADIEKITRAYHAWRGEGDAGVYEDVPGFCKSASLEEIKEHGYVLTPGRYVGAADVEDDDMPFVERFAALRSKLDMQLVESDALSAAISDRLARLAP